MHNRYYGQLNQSFEEALNLKKRINASYFNYGAICNLFFGFKFS
ncbi:hypothetical protein bcgnr5406_10070 [Bacillus cereus]